MMVMMIPVFLPTEHAEQRIVWERWVHVVPLQSEMDVQEVRGGESWFQGQNPRLPQVGD